MSFLIYIPILLDSPNMRPFQGIHRRESGETSKTMLSRGDYNRKIRTRKQRTDVGKYSFVNRTINSWNQLPAGLLAHFLCKANTFRKSVKNVITNKGIQVETECK